MASGGSGVPARSTVVPALASLVPVVWSVVLAVLLLGPALGPGLLLSYDMVWVPDLALRPDVFGLGSSLPRAVPSDAVVGALDELLPGWVLQKAVLLGGLVAAGTGASRLVPEGSLAGRLVAATLYQWNPFVAERLLIGHWPVLVGYAVLPWVVLAGSRWRRTGTMPASLWWLVPVGSLSAGSGLVTAVAVVAFAAAAGWRRWGHLSGLLLLGNAPWLVAGLLHASAATTDPAGARAFALHGEGSLAAPLAALGLGGIWNAEVVPPSRTGPLAWFSLLVLLVLVTAGVRRLVSHAGARDCVAYAACWAVGWGVAVLTWLAPGPVAWLVSEVPGGGLVRDGARLLALCAPALAVAAGHGASALVAALPSPARLAASAGLVLLPVMLLPDLAFGLSGRLRPVDYPADYARARAAVEREVEAGRPGDLLVLPLSAYRQPDWNGGRTVLDPVGRFLTPDYVAADDLVVSGVRIAGEDPRAAAAARALALADPGARSRALADLGIGFVAVVRDAGSTPRLEGRVVTEGEHLLVRALERPAGRTAPATWVAAMATAWTAYAGSVLVGVGVIFVNHRRGGRRSIGGN